MQGSKFENRLNANQEKVFFPYLMLGLFAAFVVFANHNALFISDYYYFLVAIIGYGCCFGLINHRIKLNTTIACLCALLGCLALSTLLNFSLMDRGTLLSYCVWFLAVIVMVFEKNNLKSLDFVIKCNVFGAMVVSLLVILFQKQYGETGRYTIQIGSGEIVDPNYLAAYMFNGLFFGILFYLKRERNVLLLIELVVIFCGIALTGSRAAYLCVCIVGVGFLLQYVLFSKKKKASVKNFVKPFLLLLVFCAVAVAFIVLLPDNLKERFSFSSLFDDSNQMRLEHWWNAIEVWKEKPLLGFGAAHTKVLLQQYVGHTADAHNTFLTILLHFGLIGSLIFIFLLWQVFFPVVKNKNIYLISYVVAFFAYNCIIANHLGVSFWLPIIYFLVMSRYPEEYLK